MSSVSVNDKEQAAIVDGLAELYQISPCRPTADALAGVWLAVFPQRVFPDTAWAYDTVVPSPKAKAPAKSKAKGKKK